MNGTGSDRPGRSANHCLCHPSRSYSQFRFDAMPGLSDLPSEVYVQEDLQDPQLRSLSSYLVFTAVALVVAVAFSTQYFAYLLDFTSRLSTYPGSVTTPQEDIQVAFRYISFLLAGMGVVGLPLGYWYSKQPKTLRFRGAASICLLLLAAAPLFYVYSFEQRYSFWLILKWAYLYFDVPPLRPALYWSGGLGLGVALFGLCAVLVGTSGHTFEISGAYGSAHWGDGTWLAEGRPHTKSGRLLSQAEDRGVPIGWRGNRMLYDRAGLHTYVQAPTGSGKTVGFVVPTLLLHPGSLLAIDIKRELYHVAARRRHEINGKVCRLDPFARDIDPARYNPLDLVYTAPARQSADSTAIDDAQSIANSLVVKSEGSTQNPFFIDSARQMLWGLILYVCASQSRKEGDRHLGEVRRILMRPNGSGQDPDPGTLRWYLNKMQQEFDPQEANFECKRSVARVISQQGAQFAQMSGREFSSVASTARTQTAFLSSDHIQDSISETTFRFKEMQTRDNGLSVFLSLPADRLSDYYRWLRLMIISARTELIRLDPSERRADHPTLMMIEEAPRLGRMEAINEGVSLDRGAANIQYMIVAQSFNQLKDAYGEELANNILSNCRMKMMWGAATQSDAEMISGLCGQRTVAFQTSNTSESRSSGEGGKQKTVSQSIQEQSRDLVTPDEVSRISEDWTFVFTRGEAPLLLQRPNYVEDVEIFGDHADHHPEHASQEAIRQARQRRVELGIETPPERREQPSLPSGDGLPSSVPSSGSEGRGYTSPDLGVFEGLPDTPPSVQSSPESRDGRPRSTNPPPQHFDAVDDAQALGSDPTFDRFDTPSAENLKDELHSR